MSRADVSLDAATDHSLNAILACGLTTPGRPALFFDDDVVTFGDLDMRSRRLARGLTDLGIRRGDRVGIWLTSCPEWLEFQLAAARLGVVVVAVNTRFRAHEVQDILERGDVRTLVFWPAFRGIDFAGMVAALDPAVVERVERIILVRGGKGVDLPAQVAARAVHLDALRASPPMDEYLGRPDDRCVVFTSSGTTSKPKLVAHRQSAVVAHVAAVAPRYGYEEKDAVLLHPLPLCGIFGFMGVVAALHSGRPTVLMSAFDPRTANALVERHRATHIAAGDDMLRMMFEAVEGPQLRSLRSGFFAVFSGNPAELIERGERHGIELFTGYGSSEAHSFFTYKRDGAGVEERALMGGYPVNPDNLVRARDVETGEILPPGQEGELEVGGPTVMAGLLDDPERERGIFTEDGFVRTGDLGYVTADGQLIHLHRLGDTLRLGGFLVSPREIEEFLERLDGIDTAQVVSVTVDGTPKAFAFVVTEPGANFDEATVVADCRAGLAKYKTPVRVVALEAFPLVASPNGNKIHRRKLAEMAQDIVALKAGMRA